MNIRNITDSVVYIGVNDRDTDRFENLWPLPYGVSYNSYLVKGNSKIAMIDTVETGSIQTCLKYLKEGVQGRKLDYLVVNHMEPDHSGGIPMILCMFPEIKIIGNKQTIMMLKGYFGISEDKFVEIKDGEEIDLGDKTLRFILTPMVHWPETMMTYLVEDKVLFTGDAFGSFGALNGGVVDFEMDTEWYDDEIYRYYSNIVGKYGKPVQKALEKIKNIEIEYICSTHGPVWHDRIEDVGRIYNSLSNYESEEGVTIIYGTMYGNTAEIVEVVARRLCERGIRNIKIHNASKSHLSYMISDAFRYKGLIVASPTYSMRVFPPVEQFMIAMETREIKNKVLATIGSYTWSSASLSKLNEYSSKMNIEVVDSFEMKHAPKQVDIDAALLFADKVAERLKVSDEERK